MSATPSSPLRAAVIGAGPAGLMAAEVLAAAGLSVDVFDAMPSVARKFLLAGKGGLNITHAEPFDAFLSRYGARAADLAPLLGAFGPEALRHWVHDLGIETFIGTSGRVFPAQMKAAPLLRAWLRRLRDAGVRFHARHRWCGWNEAGELRFAVPSGIQTQAADAVVLALGGGSWRRLGSDAAWVPLLLARGIEISPLEPANCGFEVEWSEHFRERFAGYPVKSVFASVADGKDDARAPGEFVVTQYGVEGSLVYALSARLRNQITATGVGLLELDLVPGRSERALAESLASPRGARSLANHLRTCANIEGVKAGLLRETSSAAQLADPVLLAAAIKTLRLRLLAPRPLDEAISTAGGVAFEALDERLMLRALPGVFCAGEMLDWEAPTGGYLLTACFASGRAAGLGVKSWLNARVR